MRRLVLLLLIMLGSFYNAQNLSVKDLLLLKNKSVVYAEEFLNARGWEYYKNDNGSFVFSFNMSMMEAEAFLMLHPSKYDSDVIAAVTLEYTNRGKYQKYLEAIKSLGAILSKSTNDSMGIYKTYKTKNNIFLLEVVNSSSPFSVPNKYYISILPSNKILN